jgi:hypothetical protein
LVAKDLHDRGCEHVHAEEAEVVPGAQAGDCQPELRLGGRRLLNDRLDQVEFPAARDAAAPDGAEVGEQTLPRGLHGRDRAFLGGGCFDQLPGTRLLAPGDVEVIADEVQEGLAADEVAGAVDGVTIP